MARKIRCFQIPDLGYAVVNPNDKYDPELTWFVARIREWNNTAKPGDEFILRSARFTRRELNEMPEYEGE